LAATLDLTGKTVTLPAGVGGHASGTQANRPASPSIGTIYFNTDEDMLQQYTSTGWEDVGTPPPAIAGITGTIYSTIETTLTISGTGFGAAATVRFAYGGSATDVLLSSSDISIQVTVPSAVYNQAGGTSVTISVISAGRVSNGVSKTVLGVPTGGNITTNNGYRIHTFTSSGFFVVPSGTTITDADYLIAGGGGAGGDFFSGSGFNCAGGGGGAGGLLTGTIASITASSNTITVGLGGVSTATSNTSGGYAQSGTNTSAFDFTAIGGGRGAAGNGTPNTNDYPPSSGGSGGGGVRDEYTSAASGTTGQGNRGANYSEGAAGVDGSGGGGGGKGSQGKTAANYSDGGDGFASSISGSTVVYAAGGGGGGGNDGVGPGAGGSSGAGGAGGPRENNNVKAGNATTPGSGGGGGGASGDSGPWFKQGGNGADGIVIVRYQLT
jgi:hypothetical protein